MDYQIGLIGGMGWASTAAYYTRINRLLEGKANKPGTAPILISSVDFAPIARMQDEGRWPEIAQIISGHARVLEKAGCRAFAICSNTIHKVAGEVKQAVRIPLLDIRQACTAHLKTENINKLVLLGTRFTVKEHFFRTYLANNGIAGSVQKSVYGGFHISTLVLQI
jgi:aspartate racemase